MTIVSGAVPRVVETVRDKEVSTEWILALAGVATPVPEEMKNKHSWKGKSRLRLLMAVVDVPEVPVVLEQCTTPLDGGVPAGGPAGHRDMR